MLRTSPLLLTFFLFACSSAGTPMQEPPPNPYAKNYVSSMKAPTASTAATPQIYRGQDRIADYQTLLEDGYDLLGYSSFEAADVPPEKLTEQAKKVNADLALVYTTRSGEVPASVKLDQAKEKMAKKQQEKVSPDAPKGTLKNFDREYYNYFASYWVKLPTPLLGVHVKQEKEAGFPEKGLEVIAVIKGSPAATAGLQKGDTLMRLGEMELSKPELLTQAAQRYAGQKTDLVVSRLGQEQHMTVTLNAR